MSEILDSGNRREFGSGTVRDIDENKGRCDLLPLNVVSMYFSTLVSSDNPMKTEAIAVCSVIKQLDKVLRREDDDYIAPIMQAARVFISAQYKGNDTNAMLELSMHYKEGAKKYAERNWEKGIPVHCYIDSCVRHLLKWYDGWEDEPHDRAVLWNLFGLAWTLANKPECDDRPKKVEKDIDK